MFLYLVTCVCDSRLSKENYTLYVVASNPAEAQESALTCIRNLQYKYDDYVEKVELLASVNTYRAGSLLVLP